MGVIKAFIIKKSRDEYCSSWNCLIDQFGFWKNFLLFPQYYSISLKSSSISLTTLQSQSGQTLCVERYSVMQATSGDHNHCLNFHQGSEFVPIIQLRIELYRPTRTQLINQCWHHNTQIYPVGCILISTNLRRTGVLLFWYQYIPVIAWPARGLYFPFRLHRVHLSYHQAPWWTTAQLRDA